MTKHKPTDPPLKYPGGKFFLRKEIVACFPDRKDYRVLVEPYCGSCAITLAHDPEGRVEICNDIDGQLINFWRVLQNQDASEELAQIIVNTPVARQEFDEAKARLLQPSSANGNKVRQAADFFLVNRQSVAAQGDDWVRPVLTRTRRRMSDQISAWGTAIDNTFEKVKARLMRILIENKPALEVIKKYADNKGVVTYADPPYLQETRVSKDAYKSFEMSSADHVELLTSLKQAQGFILLSGYPSNLYDDTLKGWHRFVKPMASHAGQGATKGQKLEVLWLNYRAPNPPKTLIYLPPEVATVDAWDYLKGVKPKENS